ncbi:MULTISPECIES: DUF6249 domain-containing protein [unclassified Brevundimonas]|uniref:DUF6249 domain-containing protein n=1 Tax=unclassified Brevundimonas TaxID=2622653 RepID=UPI0025C10CA8|nr:MULTISPECIES: DUF6249 domain-containing protein [unclassified Brevundimonas]
MEEIVAIIAILSTFGTIAAICVLPSYFKHRSQKDMQKTVRTAIGEGQSLPAELIEVMTRDVKKGLPSKSRDIRRGVLWIAAGVGLALMGQFTSLEIGVDNVVPFNNGLLGVACVPFVFGIAYLILSRFNKIPD